MFVFLCPAPFTPHRVLRFICVVAIVSSSFLCMAEEHAVGWLDHTSLIHHLLTDLWDFSWLFG